MTDLEFRDFMIESVTELKTDMKSLIGNGQPGRIDKIETDIDELKASKNRFIGIAIGASSVISVALEYLYRLFRH